VITLEARKPPGTETCRHCPAGLVDGFRRHFIRRNDSSRPAVMSRLSKGLRGILALLLVGYSATSLAAPGLQTEIIGLEGAELANVRAYLSLVHAERQRATAAWRIRKLAGLAPGQIRAALKPFGYYQAHVDVRLVEPFSPDQPWRAIIKVDRGPPVRISVLDLEVSGPAAKDPEFQRWQAEWPLPIGSVMQEPLWTDALRSLSELAGDRGYFDKRFLERSFWVYPERGEVEIRLRLDSGPRYRFGQLQGAPLLFRDPVLKRLTVVEPGEPFTVQRVDEQREVLAGSGLFDRIIIEEQLDRESAAVDLEYQLNVRPPNSYRVSAGFGTDTGPRMQLHWIRHYLSDRGDRLDSGFGVQQRDGEFVVRSEYLYPRDLDPGAFLTASGLARRQRDELRFSDDEQLRDVFGSFSGSREQFELRLGRLDESRLGARQWLGLEQRLFVAALHERFDVFRQGRFSEENEALLAANPELAPLLRSDTNTLAVGAAWRLPQIRGIGFFTEGYLVETRLLAAHKSLGSDVSFAQSYVRGRWHQIFGERHKLLLGAEIGHTKAKVRTLELELDDRFFKLSITDLPEFYRFKTGGDSSVRGYRFDTLSTNRNGANNLLTGSVEYEYRVGENWSVGVFYDVGNAFNDWNERNLKRGVGVGFRWYTAIGPIQFDIASSLDDPDRSGRLHFTFGTRLL